jgi:hypothetical protein
VLFRSAWGEIDEAKMLAKLAQQLEKGLKKEGLDVMKKCQSRWECLISFTLYKRLTASLNLRKNCMKTVGLPATLALFVAMLLAFPVPVWHFAVSTT